MSSKRNSLTGMNGNENNFPPFSFPPLRGLGETELSRLVADAGFPAFRGKQLFHWLQKKAVRSFDEMTNVSRDMCEWLKSNTRLGGVADIISEKTSSDGSTKFLFELKDGKKVESVLMPGAGTDVEKMTLCVSSQVGCAVDCKFCVTGANGFFRQMTVDEIVDQALYARSFLQKRDDGRILRNVVFMGMGEPLLNTENVIPALRLMINEQGMNLSPRRVTVSTSGILPGLRELATSGTGAAIAISLNAVSQEQREEIMPVTRKYPLQELLDVCRNYPLPNNRRITFEYVLLAGVNDSTRHAREVVRLLHGIPSKMNVIPFNPDPALPYERPTDNVVEEFAQVLRDSNLTCSVRWSKALDVSGACGQLAGQYRQRTAEGGFALLPRE